MHIRIGVQPDGFCIFVFLVFYTVALVCNKSYSLKQLLILNKLNAIFLTTYYFIDYLIFLKNFK